MEREIECAACGAPAQGNYSIHRDGFAEGPEVPLCDGCGEGETPGCEAIWLMIAARMRAGAKPRPQANGARDVAERKLQHALNIAGIEIDRLLDLPGAWISEDGRYRYGLSRRLNARQLELGAEPPPPSDAKVLLFLMLNPSTADAKVDDPTIRRCIDFGGSWGFSRLLVANLYALRSSNPGDLMKCPDPVGPYNDVAIRAAALRAHQVICAWGRGPLGLAVRARAHDILPLLPRELFCLVRNEDGSPKHPLYIAGAMKPVSFVINNRAR